MEYNFDTLYNLPEPSDVKDAAQARDIAQQWQTWASEQSLSYGELAAWGDWFRELGKRFNLIREFKREGIL